MIDPDTQTYQGSSPDEVALVQGAAMCGVVLESLQFGEVVLSVNGEKREYKIHEMIEFDSDRKSEITIYFYTFSNFFVIFQYRF